MATETDNPVEVVRRLEHQPLRNIVLLKHIEAFREHVSVAQVSAGSDTATLVLLDTTASIYDRETYPQAAFAALISSDHPRLTRRLLSAVPTCGNVVFKLASDDDRNVVGERFPISRATSFLSFTGDEHATFVADSEVSVSSSASDKALRLFESQGHPRDWLLPLLAQAGRTLSGERGQSAVDPAGHVSRAAAIPAAHAFPHVVVIHREWSASHRKL
jgi:hypothetical protein